MGLTSALKYRLFIVGSLSLLEDALREFIDAVDSDKILARSSLLELIGAFGLASLE